jgi:hypothetical protein
LVCSEVNPEAPGPSRNARVLSRVFWSPRNASRALNEAVRFSVEHPARFIFVSQKLSSYALWMRA